MIIGVDFDGTCCQHWWPEIGPPVPGALKTLRDLVRAGHELILHTCRTESGEGDANLGAAVAWLRARGVDLHGVNANQPGDVFVSHPKPFAHVYIDDAALGCPLVYPGPDDGPDARPYVDWGVVREQLDAMGAFMWLGGGKEE